MAILKQGDADGLCGIYCLLNFLNGTDWRESPTKGLWYLLDACRHFGWLSPQTITDGFEDYQLKKILDLQLSNYRMDFVSYFLTDAAQSNKELSNGDLITKICDRGGAVILGIASGKHWVLIKKISGQVQVLDSDSDREDGTRPFHHQLARDVRSGIVILPFPYVSEKVEI